MPAARKNALSPLSDDELLAAIRRDLRAIYTDVIRQPLPRELSVALKRLETHALVEKAQPRKQFQTA